MNRLVIIMIALALAAGSALAQNGNPCPGAKAYQVNIIGVPKGKTPDMTGDNGHRIFVPLTGSTSIFMTGDTDPATAGLQCGNDFVVLDANGTDGNGATLLVPCTNVGPGSVNPGVCFDVFATPLGSPNGFANVDVVCTFNNTTTALDAGSCTQGNIDFTLTRNGGKPVQKDITNFMRASGCFDTNGNGICDKGETGFNNIWIFNLESLLNYFWIYDNHGLRVAQIRFCESTSCGSVGPI